MSRADPRTRNRNGNFGRNRTFKLAVVNDNIADIIRVVHSVDLAADVEGAMHNRHKLPLIQQHRAISCGNVGAFTLGARVQDQKI